MPGNLGIVEDHFFSVAHDDQRQVCLCWSYGRRTYHDDQPELIHARWPNQSIANIYWVAHGETSQFWRVVQWSSGWRDWVRNNSRNFTDAYTIQICFGRTRSRPNQLCVSYRDFFLINSVWTSFCGSTTLSLLCTKTCREPNSESALKHLQCLLCVTSRYFVAFFSETVNNSMTSIVVG